MWDAIHTAYLLIYKCVVINSTNASIKIIQLPLYYSLNQNVYIQCRPHSHFQNGQNRSVSLVFISVCRLVACGYYGRTKQRLDDITPCVGIASFQSVVELSRVSAFRARRNTSVGGHLQK